MAIECIGVEIDLGIEADEVAIFGQDERIDFNKAHVLLGEGAIERAQELCELLLLGRAKP